MIQVVLIVAAMSSLNSGLYSTGRVLRSLGMSKQAPQFTLKMSSSGVPWAGIVMTSVVFVFGSVLNSLAPDAFEIALEAAAIGVLFTWGDDLRLPAAAAAADRPRGDPTEPVPGCRALRGPATSGWPSSRWSLVGHGHLGLAGARRTSRTRPTSWSSSSGSRSSPWSSRIGWRAGQARGRREHRRPAQGGLVRRRPDATAPGVTPDDLDVAEHDPAPRADRPERRGAMRRRQEES